MLVSDLPFWTLFRWLHARGFDTVVPARGGRILVREQRGRMVLLEVGAGRVGERRQYLTSHARHGTMRADRSACRPPGRASRRPFGRDSTRYSRPPRANRRFPGTDDPFPRGAGRRLPGLRHRLPVGVAGGGAAACLRGGRARSLEGALVADDVRHQGPGLATCPRAPGGHNGRSEVARPFPGPGTAARCCCPRCTGCCRGTRCWHSAF